LALTFVVTAGAFVASEIAWAQLRTLPVKAKRATLQPSQYPFVVLGREKLRLAPGALIYDTNNRTILPNYLPAQADVVFTTDSAGNVSRIYLLTPQEIQQLEQSRR
jgi:hypothetical protein